ncbi:ribonuclease HII [Hwanghaeella grinnelliae]|uniref:Ribonuclease HII n=1 Tax=Hwanghaeella grinnelliae TaxID=2500179 RepID=A0A3S2Z7F0_9PROT|nr:ribonuclease HII [Hwanghaeella grinnelliae]RVU35026.1 ribonuclease HII [Hwanghaeella grinnelliae]
MPDFSFENAVRERLGLGLTAAARIAGVDEVGRGPWAGPVVACAAVLNPATFPPDLAGVLDDSKKLSPKKRAALLPRIIAEAEFSVAEASVEEIDRLNILQASLLAMRRAVDTLPKPPDAALVDGNRDPGLSCPVELVVKGDSRSLSIAAASIIAKEYRDKMMAALSADYPEYGWERNAGYGVKRHQDALAQYGPTPHHRRSFAPISRLLG